MNGYWWLMLLNGLEKKVCKPTQINSIVCYFLLCLQNSRSYNYVMHDDVIKWKYFPRHWPFVRGIHRSPVNSPHKGPWALMFSLSCVWINGWVSNREAGDFRRNRAHYDVIVIDTPLIPKTEVTGAIGDKLYFSWHISVFCQKATRQPDALARISKHSSTNSRRAIYKSFIMSNSNYCPLCGISGGKSIMKSLKRS